MSKKTRRWGTPLTSKGLKQAYSERDVQTDDEGTWFSPRKAGKYVGRHPDRLHVLSTAYHRGRGTPLLDGNKFRRKPFPFGKTEVGFYFKPQLDLFLTNAARKILVSEQDLKEWVPIEGVPTEYGINLMTAYWMLREGAQELQGKRPDQRPYYKQRKNGRLIRSLLVRREEFQWIREERNRKITARLADLAEVARMMGVRPAVILVLRRKGQALGVKGYRGKPPGPPGWLFTDEEIEELGRRYLGSSGIHVHEQDGKRWLTRGQAMRKYPNARRGTFDCANKPCPQLDGAMLHAIQTKGYGRHKHRTGSVLRFDEDDLVRLKPPKRTGRPSAIRRETARRPTAATPEAPIPPRHPKPRRKPDRKPGRPDQNADVVGYAFKLLEEQPDIKNKELFRLCKDKFPGHRIFTKAKNPRNAFRAALYNACKPSVS